MSDDQANKRRVTGSALKTAAWLMEASLTGPMLYKTAIKQLGLTQLHEMTVPREAAPYRPLHLARVLQQGEGQRAEEVADD